MLYHQKWLLQESVDDFDKCQKNVRKILTRDGSEITDTKGKTVETREMKDIHCKKSLKIPKG